MLQTWTLENLNLYGVWLTIGSFDGVHLGHRAILEKIIREAHGEGVPAVALTFHPHPSIVLGKRTGPFYLSTPEEKAELLAGMGLDILITHPFNLQIAGLSARDFVNRLHKRLGFCCLCVGNDFALGHNREGNLSMLRHLGLDYGYRVATFESVEINGRVVSSSWVRKALDDGDVETVEILLGRPYQVTGEVVHGDDRGKRLGFPTANLEIWSERVLPRPGVYAGQAWVNGLDFPAVANVGFRPTFENQPTRPRVEVYIMDFEGDLYHQSISFSFVAHLRDEIRFASIEKLVEQVRKDVRQARELLEVTSHETIPGVASKYS